MGRSQGMPPTAVKPAPLRRRRPPAASRRSEMQEQRLSEAVTRSPHRSSCSFTTGRSQGMPPTAVKP
ncbi:hypothetical protein WDJ51_04530, partial [Rathayibacter sp. YIM 133350]